MIADEGAALAWLRGLPECDAVAMARLERLIALLREENQRQNLVSVASLDEVWRRHIVDSAQLLAHVPRGTSPWLDLGTGAGFPGIVVAAMRSEDDVILVESRARRIAWLEQCKAELDLPHVRVMGSRLEALDSFPAGVISARAFAPLERLIDLAARFSTKDTLWLLPKGRSARQELLELRGWNHTFHVEQSLTDAEAGIIAGTLDHRKKGRPS